MPAFLARAAGVATVLAMLLGLSTPVTAQDPKPSEDVLFEPLPVVEAASLHTQSLREAPANVTVISRKEIQKYGYRTLAEALSNVRGFYFSTDSVTTFVGVRGFSIPGDYNNKVLVLINGHALTDNLYNAMSLLGSDFGLDLELVERIEVIRGPSSALYGSNGVFATINIVTRSPAEAERFGATVEGGSRGHKRVYASTSHYLGQGANMLVSASGFHSTGRELSAPELDQSTGNVGAQQGYHTFLNLIYGAWSLTAMFNARTALAPGGWFFADFGDPGTKSYDGQSFVEAAYQRQVGKKGRLRWRFSYDQFRYWGRFDYRQEDGSTIDQRDWAAGDFAGTQLTYSRPVGGLGDLTIGGEFSADLRNRQKTRNLDPAQILLNVSRRNQRYAAFAQQEWKAGRNWTFYAGARFDDSRLLRQSVSPRLAAVYQGSPRTTWKLMYGRAFRNPSMNEMFYGGEGTGYEQNPALRPETGHTFEGTFEHQFGKATQFMVSTYHYRMDRLIESQLLDSGAVQYFNATRAKATGVEAEVSAKATGRMELGVSCNLQRARGDGGLRLPNSPAQLAQARTAVALVPNRLNLTVVARFIGARQDAYADRMGSVFLGDATLTTSNLHRDFDLQFGVRNLLGRRYSVPLSPEHLLRRWPEEGRTWFLRLIWNREQ